MCRKIVFKVLAIRAAFIAIASIVPFSVSGNLYTPPDPPPDENSNLVGTAVEISNSVEVNEAPVDGGSVSVSEEKGTVSSTPNSRSYPAASPVIPY